MTEAGELVIRAEWPDGVSPDERDIAHIDIEVGSIVFTYLADSSNETSRTYVKASAVSMALWAADNWWRLRFEPFPENLIPPTQWRLRHELTSIQGGTLWPPVMIYGEGGRVLIGPRSGAWDIPGPVRYLSAPVVAIDGDMYERKLDEFFDNVLLNCSKALDGIALKNLLATLRSERKDSELASWRKLEAQLGYDVDQVPLELMSAMEVYENRYGDAAVSEAAIAAPGIESAKAVANAIAAAQASHLRVNTDISRNLDMAGMRPTSALPPWKLAEQAAAELRKRIGKRGPLSDGDLTDALEATTEAAIESQGTASRLPYGALLGATSALDSCALHSIPRSRGRRFELGRILGDAAWLGNAGNTVDFFAPISRAKSDRQKFQRAFSQSLLCPFDDLMELINCDAPSEEDIANASAHFDVSPRVITTLLVNKGVLERERLEDQIEAA